MLRLLTFLYKRRNDNVCTHRAYYLEKPPLIAAPTDTIPCFRSLAARIFCLARTRQTFHIGNIYHLHLGAFFNEPLLIDEDIKHSKNEYMWYAFGKTDNEIYLMVVFTVRNKLIRVISARKMNKKERMYYEKA